MTIEKAIEKAARAGYEKFFEGVGELEPQWHELPLEHQFRLMQSQIAAVAAFLREAEATPAMVSVGDQRGRQFFDMPANIAGEVWNAMRWVAADEVEGGGR